MHAALLALMLLLQAVVLLFAILFVLTCNSNCSSTDGVTPLYPAAPTPQMLTLLGGTTMSLVSGFSGDVAATDVWVTFFPHAHFSPSFPSF